MASPVPPLDLFAAKFAVVTKLALLTHGFVFALFVFCGKVFAHLPGLPPVTLPLFLLRGLLGALAVIAAQLVLAMVIRSFAVPIFLGLLGGITGIFISSKGFGLLWPYSLMQLGMNSNKSADALVGSYGLFAFSCIFWLGTMFLLAWLLLKKRDVAGTIIAAAMGGLIAFQSFVNIGVATFILPNTGLPLPFVSYGLTSPLTGSRLRPRWPRLNGSGSWIRKASSTAMSLTVSYQNRKRRIEA